MRSSCLLYTSFNSTGACPSCEGTGIVRVVDESTLVPDESLSINEGAVLPWQTLMWSLMKEIAEKMGVRTNVPFRELTPEERDMVFHGPAKKVHLLYQNSKTGAAGEMDFTYFNAVYTVENALAKVTDEKGMKRVERFPVSYTHLDVYKRQPFNELALSVIAMLMVLSRALPSGELDAKRPERVRAAQRERRTLMRITDCLLYTSRCV